MERDKLISKLLFQIMIQKTSSLKQDQVSQRTTCVKGTKVFVSVRNYHCLTFELAVDKNGLPKPQAINTNLTNV